MGVHWSNLFPNAVRTTPLWRRTIPGPHPAQSDHASCHRGELPRDTCYYGGREGVYSRLPDVRSDESSEHESDLSTRLFRVEDAVEKLLGTNGYYKLAKVVLVVWHVYLFWFKIT